jgi:FkbM family methyltransferase
MILTKTLPSSFHNRRVLVSTKAYRRYYLHSLSSIHADLFKSVEDWIRPGDTVWDVGANCGIFTYAAAVLAGAKGRVIAIEADVQCASLIDRSRNYRLADEAPVVLCPFAVSQTNGIVQFQLSAYRSAANSLSGFGRFEAGGSVLEVPVFSLDNLRDGLPDPTVIKIDVEGAEALVLRGCRETLLQARPVLICECTGGETGTAIEQLLREAGYAWRSMTANDATPFTQDGIDCSDIVALPTEHARCKLRSGHARQPTAVHA